MARWILLAAWVLITCSGWAAGAGSIDWVRYTTDPVAEVETGGHSQEVRGIAISRDGQLGLTVSVDKTARLWRLKDGHLERIIRMPIDTGADNYRAHEGKLYGAWLTPDGRWAILAGYTRATYSQENPFMIYGVDLQATSNGVPTLRYGGITGLPTAVHALTMSADGKWLAACMTGAPGLLVYDWSSIVSGAPKLVAHDALGVGDDCYGLDFAPSGDLAMSTRLGEIRIYRSAKAFARDGQAFLSGLERPKNVRFSPTGDRVAFGSETAPSYGTFQTVPPYHSSLRRVPLEEDVRGIFAVAWSADGSRLWLGGERRASLEGVIYRADGSDFDNLQRVIVSERRVDDMRALPEGAVAYASAEPEVGVIEASGRPRWRKRSNTITVSPARGELRVSADAGEVAFRPSAYATQWLTFNTASAPELALQRTTLEDLKLQPNPRDSAAVKFSLSDSREELRINRQPVTLLPEERVLDHLVSADNSVAYVGTAWFIRKVALDGHSLWATPIASETEALALAGNGAYIVAALTDGAIRWYRSEDGVEVLALLALRNGVDWVAWIPQGYYESSLAGDNFLGWHLNLPQPSPGVYDVAFYRAVQFDRIFYRPDVVHAYFKSRGRGSLERWVHAGTGFDIAQLQTIAPPRLAIDTRQSAAGLGVSIVGTSAITSSGSGEPPLNWNLFVDGIPVVPGIKQTLTPEERKTGRFERSVVVTPARSVVTLRAESMASRSLGVTEKMAEVVAGSTPPRGDLYVVGAGVSRFDDKAIAPLSFAEHDAESIVSAMSEFGKAQFAEVHTLDLTDSAGHRATRAALGHLEDFLSQARGEDTVLVFLASHGLSNPQGDYYFVPADAARKDIDAVAAGVPDSGQTLISWTQIFSALQHTAGHRVLIVDTCSSAAIQGTFDAHSLAKHSLSSSFALLAASKGNEESQEIEQERHGLFTFGVLEALRTGYDPNHDGAVSVSEVFEYAYRKVEALRNRAVGTQTPQFVAPDELKDWPLVRVGLAQPP